MAGVGGDVSVVSDAVERGETQKGKRGGRGQGRRNSELITKKPQEHTASITEITRGKRVLQTM